MRSIWIVHYGPIAVGYTDGGRAWKALMNEYYKSLGYPWKLWLEWVDELRIPRK